MCHSHLEVNFDNNINFFTGRNGSGKSAILTALVVGLGARASVTNRGTSIKGFIKAGRKNASVEITLNNDGLMAYRQDVYGNKIIILRNFAESGSSSYKIKSAKGSVISTHTKEINRITSHFNIQIDNPVCILNQETSRNFLATSDSKQKFKLFVKATCLEELANEYKKIELNKIVCANILRDRKQVSVG